MDMGWTKYLEVVEKAEEAKCEGLRRRFGLVVSNDIDDYCCSSCELLEKCEGHC